MAFFVCAAGMKRLTHHTCRLPLGKCTARNVMMNDGQVNYIPWEKCEIPGPNSTSYFIGRYGENGMSVTWAICSVLARI